MAALKRLAHIFYAVLTGSAFVIVKNEKRAKVYCGKKMSKEFVISSLCKTLRAITE